MREVLILPSVLAADTAAFFYTAHGYPGEIAEMLNLGHCCCAARLGNMRT